MPSVEEETVDMPQPDDAERRHESAVPKLRAAFGAASHVGLVRSNNEDRYAVVTRTRGRRVVLTNVSTVGLNFAEDEAHVLIVADGMGGCGFGEVASELIMRIGWQMASSEPAWVMKYDTASADELRERIVKFGRSMQNELRSYALAEPQLAGMGTTWTCAYLMGQDAIIAHVGDSRAYYFRTRTLQRLTRDHTFAQKLQDAGVPAEDTTRFKHLLVNSFAADPADVKIDIDHIVLESGDRLLLCSDGLTGMVDEEEISATLTGVANPQAAADTLIEQALRNGGKDNVTVVIADLADAPLSDPSARSGNPA